jgi:hypothetical protein
MTHGEHLVGISFNPGGHAQVDYIKRTVADLIDYVMKHGKDGRCANIAVHQLEDAAMWGVKSVTKPATFVDRGGEIQLKDI